VLLVGAALTITLAGVRTVSSIIAPTVLALVLTITVHPMRAWLQRRRLPDWAASTIMLLVAYLLIVAACLMLLISIGRLAVLLPRYTTQINENLSDIGGWLADRVLARSRSGRSSTPSTWPTWCRSPQICWAVSDGGAVEHLVHRDRAAVHGVRHHEYDAGPEQDRRSEARPGRGAAELCARHRSYMVVSATFGLIVAVIDTIALWLMGVPGAFVWGVLAFVTNFIPNIGYVIGIVPSVLIALLEGPGLMIGVIVVYSVINFVIRSVIQPRVVGDRVGLSATLTFLSLVFWRWAIGPLGAILAVPLSLLLRALLVEADPDARWVLQLVSGKDSNEPEPASPEQTPVATRG
jgi:predicted PurR-regulated permease PerM